MVGSLITVSGSDDLLCSVCDTGSHEARCDANVDDLEAEAYCVDENECRSICEADSTCLAYSVGSGLCYLSSSDTGFTANSNGMTTFSQQSGWLCSSVSDYDQKVGSMTVTERANGGVDYIFEVGAPVSLEVTGTGLTTAIAGEDLGVSKDKVMVIDCHGTCGHSDPTSALPESMFSAVHGFEDIAASNYMSGTKPSSGFTKFDYAILTGAIVKIKNFETVYTSSPSFLKIMKSLGVKFEIQN